MLGDASGVGNEKRIPWPLVGRTLELEHFEGALTSGRSRGVVIHGQAGVGKTRLADEFLMLAAGQGRATTRVTAGAAAGSVPLGALAHVMPSEVLDGRMDAVGLFASVDDAFRRLAGEDPMVLLVDDMQFLDPASQLLIGQLLDSDTVFLIGTVRTGGPVPDAVATLWRRPDVVRFDLSELTHADVATLLHLALEGPVDAATTSAIWDASAGNALYVRELVMGAKANGTLVERSAAWVVTGRLGTTPALDELIESRVGALDDPARLALDVLALWAPVGVDELETIADGRTLEHLDEARLLEVRAAGRRQQVALSHPLHGEVLRRRMSPLRRRRLLLEGAARLERFGARRRADPLRMAISRLDAVGRADPALLIAAARLARYGTDFVTVERLARAAMSTGTTPEAALLLGEALHNLGGQAGYREADQVLAAGMRASHDDEQLLVQLTGLRCRNLMANLQRPTEALELNRAVRATVTSDVRRNELDADRGLIAYLSGHPVEALEVLDELARSADPRTRVQSAPIRTSALIAAGRCETALAASRQAFLEHTALTDQVALVDPGAHIINEAHALTEIGRFDEAIELGSYAYEVASRGGPRNGRFWLALGLGRTALLAGRARRAQEWLAEAVSLSDDDGSDAAGRVALSLLAAVRVWLGELDEGRAAVLTLEARPPFDHLQAEQVVGPAWVAAAAGDLPQARELLRSAADRAADTGNLAPEARLRHEAVRLGDESAMADRLEELASTCEGALIPAYGFHARAVVKQDPVLLDEASKRFQATGALLLAAEAATAADHAHRRAGSPKSATASRVRAAALIQRCEGARTPGLVSADAVVPLTTREREITSLAARGLTSREIATTLHLSRRTVENHLQSAYTKLGVTSRAALAEALTHGD